MIVDFREYNNSSKTIEQFFIKFEDDMQLVKDGIFIYGLLDQDKFGTHGLITN